jgi:hypothetical protein
MRLLTAGFYYHRKNRKKFFVDKNVRKILRSAAGNRNEKRSETALNQKDRCYYIYEEKINHKKGESIMCAAGKKPVKKAAKKAPAKKASKKK